MLHPGLKCQYYSASQGCWVPTRVIGSDDGGQTYNLECKQQASPAHIAPPTGTSQKEAWPRGTLVVYWTQQESQWLPGCVQGFDESVGRYSLDTRKNVSVDRMRARPVGRVACTAIHTPEQDASRVPTQHPARQTGVAEAAQGIPTEHSFGRG